MNRFLAMTLLIAIGMVAHADEDSAANYPSVWDCNQVKFNWYCDDEKPTSQSVPPQAAQPEVKKPVALKDIRTAEEMRAEMKRREDIAIMRPTDDNIKSYLEIWQAVQDKGSVFADNWRRVVWQNPEFDYSVRRPTNTVAINTYDAQREKSVGDQLKALAQEHGLIFFFRSDCPYCHAMAPTIKMLHDQYGIDVLGVSVDGKPLSPEFEKFTDGRQQAAAWGIERVPALFIGSKKTGDHAPIGFGIMSLSDITNRIFVLTATTPGQNF